MEEIQAYKCSRCGHIHSREIDALNCEYTHAREYLANGLLNEGHTLDHINYKCGFHWNLKEEQKQITKDNCFIISHWQCCEKPAYKIVRIDESGNLELWGKGGWDGGYGSKMRIDNLPKAYPKEDLFVYS